MSPILVLVTFNEHKGQKQVDLWAVKIKGRVYRVRAHTNAEARWEGARRYYYDSNASMTISMLYQLASCYRVYGRKEIPW